MKPKNCLIFGGSGQIGRNLLRKLTMNNYRVTVVTRNIHQKSYIIKTQANIGYIDSSLSVTISGTNIVYSTYSNTASFRFSQFSGTNMFYGSVTGENGNELYGDVSVSQNQTTGVYDLEVFDKEPKGEITVVTVSYTHLTLPTNREV